MLTPLDRAEAQPEARNGRHERATETVPTPGSTGTGGEVVDRADRRHPRQSARDSNSPRCTSIPIIPGDLFLDTESQRGGFAASSPSTSQFDHDHLTAVSNPSVVSKIFDLLNASTGGSSFDTFSTSNQQQNALRVASNANESHLSGMGGERAVFNNLTSAGLGIVIADPVDGQMVRPGDIVTVTVEPTGGLSLASVLLATPFSAQIIDSPSFVFMFEIPLNSIGEISILAFGKDPLEQIFADEIHLIVQPLAVVEGLELSPNEYVFFQVGSTRQIATNADYSDGVTRDVTSPDAGTIYSSVDPTIVGVSEDGLMTALAVGTTTIIVSNGAVAESVDVSVGSPQITPAFTGGGQRSDVDDFLTYINPTQKRTDLTFGDSSFQLAILYGETIDPSTFQAKLNGVTIDGFTPIPGTVETITIPLSSGRNTLLLSVEGIRDDGRSAKDRDRMTFVIPK